MTARLGVIGVGWWATFNHIPSAQADGGAEVVAVADLDPEKLYAAGDAFNIANRYADFRQMLKDEKLDGVMVATPHVAHTEVALPALDAGCHVLIEKPMATSAADAKSLRDAAHKAGKEILIPCGWNFRDYTRKAANIISAGSVGEVRHIACQMASALGDLFAGEPMVETEGMMHRPPASTWADPKRSGGYGWGQMSHSLAWVYRVSGLEPESVFCLAGKSPSGVDYYDAACVRMTNGATLALSGAATVPKHCGFQLEIRIFGTEGMLLFDIERERLTLHRHDKADQDAGMIPGSGEYDGTLPVTRFIEICNGKNVVNDADAENGKRVVDTLDAIYRSAASAQLEKVEG